MKRGEIITITNNPRRKRIGFVFTRSFILVVFAIVTIVLGITTATALTDNNEAAIHTVSLDGVSIWANSDEFESTYLVESGSKLNLPIPIRLNKTFAGWYKDTKHTLPFNVYTETVQQDTKLYADWTENLYTITLADPRLYLNSDGAINTDYQPQNYTKRAGASFTFPNEPEVPDGITVSDFGEFKGWSYSMFYKQPGGGDINVFAQPNTTYENFFRQNITYWAAFENWSLPPPRIEPFEIYIDFLFRFPSDASPLSQIPEAPFITPENPNIGHPSSVPLIMPNMPVTIFNKGISAYSFIGWALTASYTPGQRIYRDGEALRPEILKNFYTETANEKKQLKFYAVWQSGGNLTI